jgi:hypothetical protein
VMVEPPTKSRRTPKFGTVSATKTTANIMAERDTIR